MKRLGAIGLVAVVMALTAPSAPACHIACCAPCSVNWVEQVVVCYQPQWQVRDVQCTVVRAVPREVVENRVCNVLVPVWTEENRTITVCRFQPQEVEREVVTCQMVHENCTDPCTGCTYTACRPQYVTQRVRCQVMVPVHEQQQVRVRVCNYQPQQRNYQVRYTVCDYRQEQVVVQQRYCVMVPVQTRVKVPVACCP